MVKKYITKIKSMKSNVKSVMLGLGNRKHLFKKTELIGNKSFLQNVLLKNFLKQNVLNLSLICYENVKPKV